jgi:hypothetical protein
VTQPAPPVLGRPPDQDQRDQQALNYEHLLEAAALAALLAAIVGSASLAASLLAAGVPVPKVRQRLVAALRSHRPNVAAPLAQRWAHGVQLGAGNALADVGEQPAAARGFAEDTPVTPEIRALLHGVNADLRAGLGKAAALAAHGPLDTVQDVNAVQARALAAVNQTKAEIAWFAHSAISAGTRAVAEETGAQITWVAERDACLVCLALSGIVVEPGEEFPADATFGPKPMPLFPIDHPTPLLGPPRHGHCRCSLRLVRPDDRASHDLPAALKREAQRSVLRGFSNYASKPIRLRAADQLLEHPTLLPKTVEARARHDVNRGAFSNRHNKRLPGLPPGEP